MDALYQSHTLYKRRGKPSLISKELVIMSRALKVAEKCLAKDDHEGALAAWVRVLHIKADHAFALPKAVELLRELDYDDDAHELIWRAIDTDTDAYWVYLMALDIAWEDHNRDGVMWLLDRLLSLPTTEESAYVQIAQRFLDDKYAEKAEPIIAAGLQRFPESTELHVLYGDTHMLFGRKAEAALSYNRAARYGKVGQKLMDVPPVITDRERGSNLLAWRETLAIILFFLVLGWQDAGFNLANMGLNRWFGMALSLIGGYLFIGSTSSPQHRLMTWLLGGSVPAANAKQQRGQALQDISALPMLPIIVRVIFGITGFVLLSIAFYLVFNTALTLLFDPVAPPIPGLPS